MSPRSLVLFAATGIFASAAVIACGDGATAPDNQRPSATLSASPTLGFPPLDVDISLTCSDADGSITEYRLDADSDSDFEITRASAVDTTITFEETTTVRGQCTDDAGASSPVSTTEIKMRQEPSGSLQGDDPVLDRDDHALASGE